MTSLLLLAFVASCTATRDVVSFDFGWQHRAGLKAQAHPDDRPPAPNDITDYITQNNNTPPESAINYSAQGWELVQLPHDGLIAAAPSATACPDGCSGKSFIPRHTLWYRKEFSLPSNWSGSAVWLDFEGSFRNTVVWVNGQLATSHDCGYTPFRLRLDNLTGADIFSGSNVVAVFVDPDNGDEGSVDHGSGWWYEGGGLYRHVNLVRADPVHVEQDGLFAYSNVTVGSKPSAVVHASADIVNTGSTTEAVCVTFNLTDKDGANVGSWKGPAVTLAPGMSSKAAGTISVASPSLWSSSSPTLYKITATVRQASGDHSNAPVCTFSSPPLDGLEAPHGFRSLRYDPNDGFFLNEEHFKVRGFCDHNNFAVVGMAVPERVNLFRAQASRAIGGNGRRTSHNPPDTSMLDIYDRIGIVVMDENRLFDNKTKYVTNMGALVKRDRNHVAVVIWSFCNENGCEGTREAGGPRFQAISEEFDGSRPTLANMFTFNDLLSNTIDVQGFSHQSREKLDSCHKTLPHKPIYMSECCSCNTMRDEDVGCETLHDNPHKICTQTSFNARCAESNDATNASDGVNYAVGTMVWTLFDYYGEPPVGGPEVSSTYGQYDLCGFPKAAAFWYRTQWLLTIPDNPDKTFPTHGRHEVHLVESWESPDSFPQTKGNKTRTIHAYSSAPFIELYVNGASQGSLPVTRMIEGPGSYAEWVNVTWVAGNLTAVARSANGTAVASTSRFTNGKASRLTVSIDAPNVNTGTGTAVFLDGHDAALLRATVVDSTGAKMHLATNNISFRVVSGPGTIQGTGNGDPHSQLPNNSPWHPAYHGLVRAVVRVSSAQGRSVYERELLSQIDVHGPMATSSFSQDWATGTPIVVEASSPGFAPVTVEIPTSTNPTDSVMSVAESAAGKPVNFFQQ